MHCGDGGVREEPNMLDLGQCRLGLLQSELELLGIELFGSTSDTVAMQGVNDCLQCLLLTWLCCA